MTEPSTLARYLVIVWGDVEPTIVGPFDSEDERDTYALTFRKEEGDDHGIYVLDATMDDHAPLNTKLDIWAYSNGFFTGEDDEDVTDRWTSDESEGE